jgi:hypothetical protein
MAHTNNALSGRESSAPAACGRCGRSSRCSIHARLERASDDLVRRNHVDHRAPACTAAHTQGMQRLASGSANTPTSLLLACSLLATPATKPVGAPFRRMQAAPTSRARHAQGQGCCWPHTLARPTHAGKGRHATQSDRLTRQCVAAKARHEALRRGLEQLLGGHVGPPHGLAHAVQRLWRGARNHEVLRQGEQPGTEGPRATGVSGRAFGGGRGMA